MCTIICVTQEVRNKLRDGEGNICPRRGNREHSYRETGCEIRTQRLNRDGREEMGKVENTKKSN